MDEVEIHVLHTQFLQAFVERSPRDVVAMLVIPELGGDEDVVSGDARFGDALAHACFVAVEGCGVDGPVAGGQCGANGGGSGVVIDLPGAEPQAGRAATIVKQYGVSDFGHAGSPCVAPIME